jgi:eukaryotic-like serine/threonine-protein kinase
VHDQPNERQAIAFGPFEWDAARAELRKHGVRLKLTGQPLELLTILLAHADRLVTREELRRKLWGARTFVDFEQGLNTAIARLRHALDDSAEHPRYIETVPGRGYRFIARVAAAAQVPEIVPTRRTGLDRRTWLAACLGFALGAAGAYLGFPRPSGRAPSRLRRFVVSGAPAPPFISSTGFQDIAISPDGRRIGYRAGVEGVAHLYVRELSASVGQVLPEPDVYSPFFSPDGSEVAYYQFTSRALLRSPVQGGPASRITEFPGFLAGASWGEDGQIVFGTIDFGQGLMRVSAAGGEALPLTQAAKGFNHVLPEWLPDGRGVLFTIVSDNGATAEVAVLDVATGEHVSLTPGSQPRYAVTGHVLYLLGDNLMAAPFDVGRMRLTGAPVAVVRGLQTSSSLIGHTGQYSVARDGSLLIVMRAGGDERRLVWVDRNGREQDFPAPPRGYTYPRISPDGKWLALNMRDSRGADLDLWNLTRADATPLSIGRGLSLYPVWLPDSSGLVYGAGLPQAANVYFKSVNGDEASHVIESFPPELRALYFFSPSGSELVFARQGANGAELQMVSLGGEGRPVVLLRGARNAELAPDGRHMAYQSDDSGQFEIYVRSFPSVDDRYMAVSVNGGIQPAWSPRGDELFYLEPGPRPRLMSVAVGPGPSFTLSRPRPLFDWPYYMAELGRTYDVSRPEGDRFLAIKGAAERGNGPAAPQVEIILDWLTR